MQITSPILFLEINNSDLKFIIGENDENNVFKLKHLKKISTKDIEGFKRLDFDLIYEQVRKNIYSIEKEFNIILKEVIVIINNFDCSLINCTGFKKLNGSQLEKENISYILNSLKTNIDKNEKTKTILHIFNSKYFLDKKNIENLPIGLFGNFYSHELSFFLINENDYKNLRNIINKCNLKISKVISKSFVEGIYLISQNNGIETFFKIEINDYDSQIMYFDQSALKFFQNFNFGADLIIKDISKVIALNKETIKDILINSSISTNNSEDEFIEKKFFKDQNYRKIKKKLILDIASARIEELSEIILFKNTNVQSFLNDKIPIFLMINDNLKKNYLNDVYKSHFTNKNELDMKFIENFDKDEFYKEVNKLVQFGWKKEAVPIVHEKKSIIARIFNLFFN